MTRKEIVLRRLNELLPSIGYERITTPSIKGFFKVYPNYVDLFTVGFYMRSETIDIIFDRRSFPEVAIIYNKILEKTRFCSWAWRSRKLAITPILINRETEKKGVGYYQRDPFSASYCKWLGLDTENALYDFCDWIVYHLVNEESEFSKRYTTLPSVLERMNELDEEKIFWGNGDKGILAGYQAANFTGLIISKLCNDPKYGEKLERVRVYFSEDDNEEWLPCFERFCSIIEHVEPRYNV